MRLVILLLCFISLTGCGGLGGSNAKVTYHTLSGSMTLGNPDIATSKRLVSLGVGPLKLPSLLDRKGFVVRYDDNTVEVRELHEWGGQLQDEVLSALTQQLQQRLPQARVQRIPWEISQTPRYQVKLTVDRFDGQLEGDTRLQGTWQLQFAETGRIVNSYSINLSERSSGKTISDTVKVQNRLIEQLAEQIVQKLAINTH